MKGIWLLRHGALPPNPERRLTGARDIPLSAAGRAQVRALAQDFLPALEPEPAAVLCSDLGRCRETAALLLDGRQRGWPLHVEPDLREIGLGLWEGLTWAEVRDLWPGAFEARGLDMMNYVPPGGESFRMVQRRALHALARWRQRYPGGTLLLITHAGVMRALLARYFSLPLEAVWHIPGQCASRRFLPGW